MVHRQTEAYAARTKSRPLSTHHGKRKAATLEDDLDDEANGPSRSGGKKRKQEQSGFPGGGRKGVSSGLSVIIRKNGVRIDPPGHARASRAGEVAAAASTDAGNWWE
jgi:RNA exonuclease 4